MVMMTRNDHVDADARYASDWIYSVAKVIADNQPENNRG
jgi:hypothetical protein